MTFTSGQAVRASVLNAAIAAATANAPQLIGSAILLGSSPSISITIPAGFNHLRGIYTARQDSGSGGAFAVMRLNGDSGNNYEWQDLIGQQAVVTSSNAAGVASSMRVGVITGSGDTANYFGTGSFDIGNCSSAVFKPMTSCYQCPISTTNGVSGTAGGQWSSTAVVTSVALLPNSGNLIAGSSMSIYGWQ